MTEYPYALRDELHKALDKAGIKYRMIQGGITLFECCDGCESAVFAYGYTSGNREPVLGARVVGIKDPKQVIAMVNALEQTCAVDGEGYDDYDGDIYRWYSLTCGHRICIPDYMGDAQVIGMYCPYCARRIAG